MQRRFATLTLLVAWSLAVAAPDRPARATEPSYRVLATDLEPLRADFNRARDHVRAVLLVGPT